MEVLFCDLCGASVPVGDLANGAALKHQGKLVGACCLSAMRGTTRAHGVAAGARGSASEGRLLPVAVVLLAAVAAATIFLDQRIAGADEQWRAGQDQVLMAQRSDSEVLQAIGVAMDGAARKSDLEGLTEKIALLDGALQQQGEQLRQLSEQVRREVAAVRQEVQVAGSSAIDYRPLFDEMRNKQQRLQEAVDAALRAAAAAPVSAAPPVDSRPAPAVPDAPVANALPPALAEHVRRLQASDPAVRFEAVDELLSSREPAVVPHVLPLARDPDSFVRRLTVEGLRDFKRPEVVDALLVALNDSDDSVAETAWQSLKELTGQKIPFETRPKDARARAVQRWQEWWDKNKAAFGS
ncbi:MAG TPA: HEAT repeat domain-containing protein [Planctomycetota bacterium]|nr:HEAT repeat domain-containing protein [Planctomycetota bacterium]